MLDSCKNISARGAHSTLLLYVLVFAPRRNHRGENSASFEIPRRAQSLLRRMLIQGTTSGAIRFAPCVLQVVAESRCCSQRYVLEWMLASGIMVTRKYPSALGGCGGEKEPVSVLPAFNTTAFALRSMRYAGPTHE